MLQPNDLPLVCLPLDLPDAAAAELVEFLHQLTEALERHYAGQLHRYYSAAEQRDCEHPPSSTSTDATF
jgi:hypothetical protein